MISWLLIIFIILIFVYIIIILVDFRPSAPEITASPIIDVTELSDVQDIRFQECNDPWGNTLPGFWYDTLENVTVSVIATGDPPVAKFSTQPVYRYGNGRRSCY